MITEEQLNWLRAKKIRGDISAVVKQLNPRRLKAGISYSEACSIVNGDLVGQWGEEFIKALEKRIRKRERRLLKLKDKYSLK